MSNKQQQQQQQQGGNSRRGGSGNYVGGGGILNNSGGSTNNTPSSTSPPVMLRNSTSTNHLLSTSVIGVLSSSIMMVPPQSQPNNNNNSSNNNMNSSINSNLSSSMDSNGSGNNNHIKINHSNSFIVGSYTNTSMSMMMSGGGVGGGGGMGGSISDYSLLSNPSASISSTNLMKSIGGGQGNQGGQSGGNSNAVGSFTQNYELYSMNKLFCINTTKNNASPSSSLNSFNSYHRRLQSRDQNNSNTGSGGGKDSNTSKGNDKSLSDHFSNQNNNNNSNQSPTLSSSTSSLDPSLGVHILLEAQGGYDDHLFFAMYCSNDYLIFRFVGQSKVPIFKYIQWSKESNKKIVSMSFDPTAQWLLCLSHDTSLVRIPIYFMMCKKINVLEQENIPQPIEKSDKLSSWVSSKRLFKSSTNVNEPKLIQNMVNIPPLSQKGHIGTSCIWWKTSNSEDYGIVSTTSGSILFVNLSTNEVQKKIKIESHVYKMELVNGGNETFLIISTKTLGYIQLNIEQKINHHQFETIITAPPVNNKQPNPIYNTFSSTVSLFSTDRVLSDRALETQHSKENGLIVASYIKSTSKLEIYDSMYLHKFPLFVYQLPQTTTKFYFTKNITFISEIDHHDDQARMNVSIVSNLVSGTASNSKYIKNQSTIQTFQLAQGEVVLSITNSLTQSSSNDIANQINNQSKQQQNNQNNLYNGNNNNNNNNNSSTTYLPTCYLWTNYSIYELKPKKTPEEIFFELLSKNLEKCDGEALGKTFRMDLLSLYETAADHSFDQGQYGRALDLYYLSGVKTSKLVLRFLEIGRMDIIMTHLKAVLHQPDTFSIQERKKLNNILFQCYLQRLMASKEDFKSLETEFSNFLSTNQDYDVGVALQLLLANGLLDYFFSVAHSRKLIPYALNSLLECNRLHLDAQNISLLQSQYCQELKSNSAGMIFDCLSPDLQVKLILEDTNNIPRYVKRLFYLLPLVNEKTLIDIATQFDPLTFEPFNITNSSTSGGNSGGGNSNSGSTTTSPTIKNKFNSHSPTNSSSNLLHLDHTDISFETANYFPGRSSEMIPIRNEEYFELYLIAVMTLVDIRRKKYGGNNNSNGNIHDQHEQQDKKEEVKQIQSEDEVEEDEPERVVVDPDLLLHPMPSLKLNEKRAVSVSCGWEHVAVITSEGELFTWGNNLHYQLGHGLQAGKYQSTPMRVESLTMSPIIMVSCGGEHTVAIDRSYHLYSMGSGKFGQLGHGVLTPQNVPKRIEDFTGSQKILAVACGYAHTLVLKSSGDLFAFGCNESGQLGTNVFKQHKSVPTRVDSTEVVHAGQPSRIQSIACGHSHSILRTNHGDVYSWGSNSKGQLGRSSNENCPRPKLIQELRGKNIKKIACGHYHTVVTTDLDSIYSWGQGEHMCLGNGSSKNESTPHLNEFFLNKKVDRVACGLYHTATITLPEGNVNGNVYICGGSEHGKLGIGGDPKSPALDKAYPAIIPSINSLNVVDFSSGSEFSAIVTTNGALYMWGSGNHGQIGNGKNEDVWVPTRTLLQDSNRSLMMGMGGSGLLSFTKQRYHQEGLEEVLRLNITHYRPFAIINKAKQFNNWDAVATIYEVLEDYKSTLECRLIALKNRYLEKDKEVIALLQLLYIYVVKGSQVSISSPTSLDNSPVLIGTHQSNSNIQSPPHISPPHFAGNGSPLLISQESQLLVSSNQQQQQQQKKPTSPEKSKELLLLLILNYWKEKNLPIEELENYILNNIDAFSLPLSNILQMNSLNQGYPLVLNFSSSLYLNVVKYYLEFMKNLGDKERELQRASEMVLISNIKDNLEKDISSRTKIHIPALVPDLIFGNSSSSSSSSMHGNSNLNNGPNTIGNSKIGTGSNVGQDGKYEKDVAFTCNHFYSKKRYFGSVLPTFQNDVEKLGIMSSTTLKQIIQEYNQKWISLSCPLCLYSYLKELKSNQS